MVTDFSPFLTIWKPVTVFLCVMQGKEEEPAPVFTGRGAGLVSNSVNPNDSERYAVFIRFEYFLYNQCASCFCSIRNITSRVTLNWRGQSNFACKSIREFLFWKQFVNVNLLCDLTQSQHSCSLIYSYVEPMRSLSPPYKTRFALMGIIQMCLSHRRDAASTGLVGDGERNTDPVSLVSRSNQNPHNPDATNTATMDISGREAGVKTVSLSLSLCFL